MSTIDAIKKIYTSKLYKRLKWHLGPVALYQELEAELP